MPVPINPFIFQAFFHEEDGAVAVVFNPPFKCLSFFSVDAGLILNHHTEMFAPKREKGEGIET